MSRIASFHLIRERPRRQPLVLTRLATDRLRLRHVDGLLFWRLLGTGRGDRSAVGADLRRSALFAVWRDEAALEAFLTSDPIAHRWQRGDEAWHVRLRGLSGHGSWHGFAVADGLVEGNSEGAVVIVTRAEVRWRSWRRFTRAAGVVNEAVRHAPGLLAAVGIGEAPVGLLGTFSVWESLGAARAFAERDSVHRDTVASTRSGDWFGEELFVRFEPYGSTGTWNGGDPLAGTQE